MGFKEKIKEHPEKYLIFFKFYNAFLGKNKIRISKGTKFTVRGALLNKLTVTVKGENNEIFIDSLTQISGGSIYINGNNNKLVIGRRNGFDSCDLWIEDDGNEIVIGEHNRFFTESHLAALEGTRIIIGSDGLYAPHVQMRTSDSHSIIDMNGVRLNQAKNIVVGDHVWIAEGSVVLKGSRIPEDCVIALKSLVNKPLEQSHCIYAGNPVRIVRENVSWDSHRR